MGDPQPRASLQELSMLLASGFACFFAGALYGWSALIAPLESTFDVTMGQTGLVFSLAIASFTTAVIAVPRCIPRTARQRSVSWFGLAGATCLIAATKAVELEFFLLWFSGGFGAASGAIYITTLGLAADTSFHKIATPAMVAAFGTGGAVFGPVWRIMGANGGGLESLFILVFGLLLSGLVGAWIPCQKVNKTAPISSIEERAHQGEDSQVLVMIWLIFAFGSFAGLMVLGMAAKMMDIANVGIGLASFGLAGIAFANTGGRLSVALLSTYLRLEQCLYIAVGFTISGVVLAILGKTSLMLCAGLILIAGGYGIVASTVPVLTRAVFGPLKFQRKFALTFTAWGVAGFVAPWAGGMMFDQSGNFLMPLVFSIGIAMLCGIVSWRLGRRI